MNKLEIHVRNYEAIDNYFGMKNHIISIGDDACIYKIPTQEKALIVADKIMNAGYEFKFTTSKLAEKHVDNMIKTIACLTREITDYTLVINDLGLLHACNKMEILPQKVHLGRGINRATEDTPWNKEFVKNENFKEDMLVNNYADTPKIKYMKKYGVTGIEATILDSSVYGFQKIKDMGWKISAHIGNSVIGIARKCAYAKYKKFQIGECSDSCKVPIDIDMTRYTNGEDYMDCINNLEPKLLQFYLMGNVLYSHTNKEIDDKMAQVLHNLVIHDIDYPSDEMQVAVEKYLNWIEQNSMQIL